MDIGAIQTIAGYELSINIRNRWIVLFTAMFGILTLAISYFGLLTEAVVGFQGFTRTSASLLNLVLYLIPIVALSMSTVSYTVERESGEMLFSQPISRIEILLGKLLGLLLSLLGSTLIGFGLAGILIAYQVGVDGMSRYLAFVGYALLLEICFLCLGCMIGVVCRTRARSFAYSIFTWFFLVIFYDLLAMGITFLLRERVANIFIFVSLFGNPVGLARVGSLIALGDSSIFGYAGAALVKFLGGRALSALLLITGLTLWALVPAMIAGRRLSRQDI